MCIRDRGGEGQKPVYTALADPGLEQTGGKTLDPGYDFGEYRERVNRYIMEHRSDCLLYTSERLLNPQSSILPWSQPRER